MQNLTFLTQTELFRGIGPEDISRIMTCIDAREKTYARGQTVFRAGDVIREIGLVEEGSVNLVVNFFWGSSSIFDHMEKGEVFAENYAAIPGKELLGDVVAAEDCRILFLNMDKLMTLCSGGCAYHNKLIRNMITIAAQKNVSLSTRMMHIAPKSIRQRLLSYFSEMAIESGSLHFKIPFSRQELADYLGVDRSALSNELSKMQREGLISFRKNDFTIREGARLPA